jgi:hypothetical protein
LIAAMLVACAGTATAANTVLAGWHDFSAGYALYKYASSTKAPDEYMSGISAFLYGGQGTRNAWGSTDGTYGSSYAVETSATDGAFAGRADLPNIYITFINNTSDDVTLDSIVFDLASVSTDAPQDLALYYDSGDLAVTDDTLINSSTGVNANGLANVSDYQDFDWSLSALADTSLAKGQRAVFRFTAANASNDAQALGLDNIAIIGEGTAGDTLADALTELKEHINGTGTLLKAEINALTTIIANNSGSIGNNGGRICQAFDVVKTYEAVEGALFVADGSFTRDDTSSVTKALYHAMLEVYQGILDDAYNTWNLNNYRSVLEGAKFESSSYFPGAVASPSDPTAIYSVQINASQTNAWGYPVDFMEEDARRPTGAYLAPGDIATVTVPSALVGKGFKIRVGAHVADLSNKSTVKRFDRVTKTYSITSTSTEVANPVGGGIYIEVPYGIDEGLVTVEIQNAVRSPFYSNSSARQTTLSEWQNTERTQPGKWADFETDKFMLTVPTDWIYAYSDPVTLMDNWDMAMDAVSDMQGLPRLRPKTVLYCIIDVLLDASAYSPGYPQSNDSWSPTSTAGGNKDHDYLNGPKYSNHVHLHELGHATSITKFSGEMEALVNFLYVPVHNRMFDVPLEESFGRSLNVNAGSSMNRKHAAINWVVTSLFRGGDPMSATEMKYQHRGYAKYVEIAALFGWDAIGDFWKSVAVDYENGISYSKNYDPPDSRIIRMSRAANANLLPLIHFWGVHPNTASYINSTLESEGILPSAAIYDRLKYYQSVVPMSAAEFKTHDNAVGSLISVNEQDQYDEWRTTWTSTLGQESVDAIQDIIDTYFPDGRPIESLPHFEGFEDGIGGWAQATDDDFEWRRQSGPTFSGAAGPDAAASGDYYMYAEGHDAPGSDKTASFQCTFDFSTRRETTLTFDYHMYGNYIDFLAVDIYDGTSWITDVWVRNGKQHNSSSDPWSTATVDLTEFSGNDEVTVRFRTKNTQYNSADPAIDNIAIEVAGPVLLPYAESFENGMDAWVQSTDDDYDWTVNSGGTDTAAAGPNGASDGSHYLYAEGHHGLGSYKTSAVQCTFDFSTVSGAELTFDYHMYGSFIDFLAVDVHDGTAWTSNVWIKVGQQHSGSDEPWSSTAVDLSDYSGNDEVTLRFRTANTLWNAADPAIDNIRIDLPLPTLPYAESFESGFGDWVQSTDDDHEWTRNSGGTDTGNTGPSGASDGSWYLYVENHDSGVQYKTSSVECEFDFSAASAPELTFDYHMYGLYIDYLSVDIYDGSSWSSNVWQYTGQAQSSSEDPWSTATVDLSAFTGNDEVTIRFRSKQKQWHAADTAIDNISIVEAGASTAYDIWAATAFSGAPGGTDMTATGNPDGDRFTNLQEWALVLDPLVVDKPSMDVSMDDSDFTVVYSRRDSDDVAVYASWATTPTATVWRVAGDGMTEASVTTSNDVETMSATVPLDDTSKFIRIEVGE